MGRPLTNQAGYSVVSPLFIRDRTSTSFAWNIAPRRGLKIWQSVTMVAAIFLGLATSMYWLRFLYPVNQNLGHNDYSHFAVMENPGSKRVR